MKEWGTPPGKDKSVNSVKGMVCAVPGNCSEDDLIGLGQSFVQQFNRYDTVTIDVFDSVDAARQYANAGTDSPAHLLLRVLKTAGARPRILLNRGGEVREVPVQAPATSSAP